MFCFKLLFRLICNFLPKNFIPTFFGFALILTSNIIYNFNTYDI